METFGGVHWGTYQTQLSAATTRSLAITLQRMNPMSAMECGMTTKPTMRFEVWQLRHDWVVRLRRLPEVVG